MKYEICKVTYVNKTRAAYPVAWTDVLAYASDIVRALNACSEGVYEVREEIKEL